MAALILVFGVFYLATDKILFYQTDNSLTAHGNKVLEVLAREDSSMHTMLETQSFIRDFSEIPGMIVLVTDSSGKVINSTSLSDPQLVNKLYQKAKDSGQTFYSDETISGTAVRFWVSKVVSSKGEFAGVVMIAHSVAVIYSSLQTLLIVLLIILIFSVIPAFFGGYFLAGRALEPISDMSKKLKKISEENLSERLIIPKTGDELEELARTFNDLLTRLADSFERERQFIGDVAHELKTPLTTLQSSFEIMLSKKRVVSDYQTGYKEGLVDIKKLSETMQNVLDLAWSGADSKKENVNLSDVVFEAKEIAVKMAALKKIQVSGKVSENIRVAGRKDKLSRAVLNLVDNAVKYTPLKSKIFISLTKVNRQAILEIKDNGTGIDSADLPHIFERFYRGKSKTTGSGLGLAITAAIVKNYQGTIKVKSQLKKGSSFIITLPAL